MNVIKKPAPRAAASGVVFDGVSKYFGDFCAVRDLNLTVGQGEFLTLLGPSGSGKTTTLMMLAGFQTPTSGDIRLDGRILQTVPPHKRNIGVVFQNYALFPHMTVGENIAFPLSVRGMARAPMERAVSRAIDLVQLNGLADRRPSQISGGQQQRVALARALVFDPPLILMHEPLGALDRLLRETLQIEIKQLHHRLGVTLVYVTHDQSEALTMSDRVAVFDQGRVQQIASPVDLYERPGSAFVAQFIGESNQFEGTVTARDENRCQVELPTGHRIEALAVGTCSVGHRVIVSIRPERLRVSPDTGPASAATVAGKITDIIFHGDSIRIQVGAASFGNALVTAKVANDRRDLQFAAGAAVILSWHTDDWRAYET